MNAPFSKSVACNPLDKALADYIAAPDPRIDWLARSAEQVRQFREQDRRNGITWEDEEAALWAAQREVGHD